MEYLAFVEKRTFKPSDDDLDRALLLFVCEARSGFEELFEELAQREIERLIRPEPEREAEGR